MQTEAHAVVDATGAVIPTAVIEAIRPALCPLPVGAELEVRTDRFPAIEADVRAWGRFIGAVVVAVVPDGTTQRLRLRRTTPVPRVGWRVAVVVSSDSLEELISPLGFALAAALEGAEVAVYLQGPGVRVLRPGSPGGLHRWWQRPFRRSPRAGGERAGHAPPTLHRMQALGARLYACGPSLDRFGVDPHRLALPDVTVCGQLTFMEVMAESDVQLYA